MVNPHLERALVRALVGAALVAAACAAVPVPLDAQGDPELPALAFGQEGLYRLEVALLVFYGSLLLITPAFSGLARGRLPIEISARGAKFSEGADRSVDATEAGIKKLEQATTRLADKLAGADIEIRKLKERVDDDNRFR
jgi:hypothetical protein